MKRIIIILLIASCSVSYAMYGGEEEVILRINECSELNVTVTSNQPIEPGEYSLINCTEIHPNFWQCHCYDNYELIMKSDIRTVNKYDIIVSYIKDSDDDGIDDTHDICPGSISEDVDNKGCSMEQFCNKIKIRRWGGRLRCYMADWEHDERRFFPRDCRVDKSKCVGTGL